MFYCLGFAGAALVIMVTVKETMFLPVSLYRHEGQSTGQRPDHSPRFKIFINKEQSWTNAFNTLNNTPGYSCLAPISEYIFTIIIEQELADC